jgi:hypothetical protein
MVLFLQDSGVLEATLEPRGKYWPLVYKTLENNSIRPTLFYPVHWEDFPYPKNATWYCLFLRVMFAHNEAPEWSIQVSEMEGFGDLMDKMLITIRLIEM